MNHALAPSSIDVRSGGRTRFGDLLTAEWIKLRSLRSTYLVLAFGAVVSVVICASSARANVAMINASWNRSRRLALDVMNSAFVPEAYQAWMMLTCSVGAIAIFGEYSSGLVRTTFTAVPARRSVVAAKIAVVTVLLFVVGAIVATASFLITQAVYRTEGIGLLITAPGAVRAIVATALVGPVCALVGMALAALIRHASGTIVAAIGVLLLLPSLFRGETYQWVKEIGNAMPLSAWTALVDNPAQPAPFPDKYPVTVTEAWIAFAAWALVAAAVAVTAVHRRDV